MKEIDKINLVKYGIIEEPFDYSFLDEELIEIYESFNKKFEKLYKRKAEQYNLKDCHFIIENSIYSNAFARSKRGYNIIGITQGYIKTMTDIFDKKNFEKLLFIALKSDARTSNSYAELYEMENFEFHTFMFNCSIQFTFGHEFQHILQLNSDRVATKTELNENLTNVKFDLNRHAWEFDADRFGSFEVLKYIHQIKNEFKVNSDDIFKCMLYLGLGSLFLTKLLYYFNVSKSTEVINTKPFYTKENSHPHPITRIFNITEYFKNNIEDLFPNLKIEIQDLLNNSLAILDNYLNSLFPKQKVIKYFFDDWGLYLDEINEYNNVLYDACINDKSIKDLLIKRGINFEN